MVRISAKRTEYVARAARARRVLVSYLPKAQQRFLLDHRACLPACAWIYDCEILSLTAAYNLCPDFDWLTWLLEMLDIQWAVPRKLDGTSNWSASALRQQIPARIVAAALMKATK